MSSAFSGEYQQLRYDYASHRPAIALLLVPQNGKQMRKSLR